VAGAARLVAVTNRDLAVVTCAAPEEEKVEAVAGADVAGAAAAGAAPAAADAKAAPAAGKDAKAAPAAAAKKK
jgi:hypothetical protein